MSLKKQEICDEQKHHQKITNTYNDWYSCQHELSSIYDSVCYHYEVSWTVDFEIQSCAPKTVLDGFLNES